MADFEAHRSLECRQAVQELIEKVRQGNVQAIVELSCLAEAGYMLRSDQCTIFSLAPSLRELLSAVQRVNGLDSNHRTIANDICLELCKNFNRIDSLSFKDGDITKTPGMMSRVILFGNDFIEIRAHLFEENAQETYIHHHCQPFITTCISGSYVHRIWSTKSSDSSKYYIHRRHTGGIYSQEVEAHDGELENVLCQPFECGQSLFISASAQHTVGDSKGKLVTIVVRDKLARNKEQVVKILSTTPNIEQPTEAVSNVTNDRERRAILESLKDALRTLYTTKLIQEPAQELIVSAREANRGIHEILQVVNTMHGEVNQERMDFAVLLVDLAILLLAWTKYSKNPTWATMKQAKCQFFKLPNGGTVSKQLTKIGIDLNVARQPVMAGDNLRSPQSTLALLYAHLLKASSRSELAVAKYMMWCFGLPTGDEVPATRFSRVKNTEDEEVGGTSRSHEYVHRDLKIPRYVQNSARQERQDTAEQWIIDEKGFNLDSLLRKDINWTLLL